MGAGRSRGVAGSSFTAGAPNQLGMAPGTETSIHLPSWMLKKASSHGDSDNDHKSDMSDRGVLSQQG